MSSGASGNGNMLQMLPVDYAFIYAYGCRSWWFYRLILWEVLHVRKSSCFSHHIDHTGCSLKKGFTDGITRYFKLIYLKV